MTKTDKELVMGNVTLTTYSNNSLLYFGWKCPNCNTVWSPYVESCKNCIPNNSSKTDKIIRE